MKSSEKNIFSRVLHVSGELTNREVPVLKDSEIWEAFKNGSEEAFMQIYKDNFHVLFRYGSQFSLDQELIKDAIQDLFIELRSYRKNLNVSKIRPYLMVAFKRKILRYKSSQQKKEILHYSLTKGYEYSLEDSIETKIISEESSINRHDKLNTAMKMLTSRQKESIYYYFSECMDYNEIKEIMGFKDIKSARNIIYKAVSILKGYLLLLSISFFL
ncbi:MAG: sigma-70 family RNA polymerase sigma factor [Cyclobacteriaceae bacterium]|nr:sigma-70 family RNA polymerase sigma factor [Cyclobacteriaceae bacterium]